MSAFKCKQLDVNAPRKADSIVKNELGQTNVKSENQTSSLESIIITANAVELQQSEHSVSFGVSESVS